MKTSTLAASLALSIFGLLAVSAHAQVLMLDFGPTAATTTNLTNSAYHTANTGFTNTTWNTLGIADANSGLSYSNGTAATGVVVNSGAVAGASTTIGLGLQPGSSSALGNPTSTGIYSGTSVGTDGIFTTTNGATGVTRVGLQIGGLAAGSYDVYIAARNTNTAAAAATYSQSIYLGTSTVAGDFDYSGYTNFGTLTYANPNASTSFTTTWIDGQNYLKLSVTLSANSYLNLAVAGSGSENRGFLNAVQIVNTTSAIPEPSTYVAFAGLGALGVALIVRRRRAAR